ncbi:MAG: DUF6064 family protein [Betaproteobacteria bacterium]
MSEWWTYRPSDFLLFAPRTYYRLVETYNAESWPWQVVALAATLAVTAVAWRRARHAGHIVAIALALGWSVVAWCFHWQRYATINWAAVYFAGAFALQAVLLVWAGVAGRLDFGGTSRRRRYAGLALIATALAVLPLAALVSGRPERQIEVVGLSPDPTAIVTLGLLLLAQRAHGVLYVVPVLWCLASGLTLWTMNAPDAFVPPLAALLAAGAAASLRLRGR